MRVLSIALLVAVSSASIAQIAVAADMPARMPTKAAPMIAPSTWTGCYVGGNVGVGWVRPNVTDEVSGAPIASLSATDFVGGGQIGCDYQFAGNWVVGLQGMLEGSTLKADTTSAALGPLTLHGSIPWYATATARLGYVVAPNWLVYAKGGAAWTHTDTSLTAGGVTVATAGFDQSGWTAGLGAEWMLAANWSVFAEYDYLGLKDTVVTLPGPNIGNVHTYIQNAIVGVNFRFGPH
jgi:outer membrane immunogenic protein